MAIVPCKDLPELIQLNLHTHTHRETGTSKMITRQLKNGIEIGWEKETTKLHLIFFSKSDGFEFGRFPSILPTYSFNEIQYEF